jgi:hypothetical protein
MSRRQQMEPTEEWAELKLRLEWAEQVEYELIRPPLISGVSVAARSRQTGTPETTVHRRITSFKSYGMRGLFETGEAQVEGHSQLDPEVRGLILNLKSEFWRKTPWPECEASHRIKSHGYKDVQALCALP